MNLIKGHWCDGVVRLPGDNSLPLSPTWNAALQRERGGECDVVMGFRPESGQVSDSGPLAGEVFASELHGAYTVLHLSINGNILHIRSERGIDHPIGSTVRFDVDPEMVRFFDPETEAAITREVQ
jgi:multiple sugar transport system ATP-binding protein